MSSNIGKNVNVKVDLSGLEKLQKNLKQTYFAKVGILAGKAGKEHEGGMTNVELGIIHEFGSKTNNIPARSFLKYPIETKGKEITKFVVKNKEAIIKALTEDGNLKPTFTKLGVFAEGIIQDAFSSDGFGNWQPLKPETIKAKGSSAILIDSGELRRAISSKAARIK